MGKRQRKKEGRELKRKDNLIFVENAKLPETREDPLIYPSSLGPRQRMNQRMMEKKERMRE